MKPIVHRNYDGGDIVLPDDPRRGAVAQGVSLSGGKVGDDIITASGTTLLGADDKAGVAIVMAAPGTCCKTRICLTARSESVSRRTRRSAAASTPICRRT